VLRPKNPYVNQQMPFLIGSREWKEKWHVGLVESDESDEEVDEGEL
jgi:WASH complex subunit FAM21